MSNPPPTRLAGLYPPFQGGSIRPFVSSESRGSSDSNHKIKFNPFLYLACFIGVCLSCAYQPTDTYRRDIQRGVQYGKASFYGYGDEFHGRKTANGEIFDRNAVTAAHPTLPFGTFCRVTNLSNGKSVVVRINDRGPFKGGRIIDLSYGAAKRIDSVRTGVVDVKVEVLKIGK
jgi:rare lipoprotein A